MPLYRYTHEKSDGRQWHQYATTPFPAGFKFHGDGLVRGPEWSSPHLRFNRMRGEWVTYSASRQERPFLPPKEYCPLCPATPGAVDAQGRPILTELPTGAEGFSWAVFENMFPGLSLHPSTVTGKASGHCEVILYTADHQKHLVDLPTSHLAGLAEVWQDRSRAVGARPEIKQVFIFENRGAEIGVTLHHAHGQLYAFTDVPPFLAREQEEAAAFHARTGRCLVCDLCAEERRDQRRILHETPTLVAYLPEAARYPYEVHVTTKVHRPLFHQLDAAEINDVGLLLRRIVYAYDHLFNRPMPYIMVHHQAQAGHEQDPSYHWHLEFYPALRTENKLKFLAGVESGAGMFINDTIPEERAAHLRAVPCPF